MAVGTASNNTSVPNFSHLTHTALFTQDFPQLMNFLCSQLGLENCSLFSLLTKEIEQVTDPREGIVILHTPISQASMFCLGQNSNSPELHHMPCQLQGSLLMSLGEPIAPSGGLVHLPPPPPILPALPPKNYCLPLEQRKQVTGSGQLVGSGEMHPCC